MGISNVGRNTNLFNLNVYDTSSAFQSSQGGPCVVDHIGRTLLANYTFRHRPVINRSSSIVVEIMLTVIQLISLDEKQQEMATKVWFDQRWTDEFVNWNGTEFDDIKWMTFRSNEIWTPDIAIDNSIKYEREDLNLHVSIDGNVWWSMPAVVRTSCNIDTRFFPFDTQKCKIVLGSWYHDPSELDLRVQGNATKMKKDYFMHNAQWDLINTHIQVNNEYQAAYDMTFRTIDFFLEFKRKSLYFLLILIVPFIMISTVSLSNFVLPCESGEKISLGITVLLSLFVNLLNLVDLLPESSDSFPLLGSYYLISMGLVASSVIMTVFVLNIHHQPIKSRRLPEHLRCGWMFLYISRILCAGYPVKIPKKFCKSHSKPYQIKCCINGLKKPSNHTAKDIASRHNCLLLENLNHAFSAVNSSNHVAATHEALPANSNLRNRSAKPRSIEEKPDESLDAVLTLVQEIKDRITREQTKEMEKEYQQYIKEEWRFFARVVDRLLGVVYVVLFVSLIFAFS